MYYAFSLHFNAAALTNTPSEAIRDVRFVAEPLMFLNSVDGRSKVARIGCFNETDAFRSFALFLCSIWHRPVSFECQARRSGVANKTVGG